MTIKDEGNDRRISPRFPVNFSARVTYYVEEKPVKIDAQVRDFCDSGFSIVSSQAIFVGASANVSVIGQNKQPVVEVAGRVVWMRKVDGSSNGFGFKFIEPSISDSGVQAFVKLLSSESSGMERRAGISSEIFPLKRRTYDYDSLSFKSPLYQLTNVLKKIGECRKIKNIVISPSLAYIHKRVREIFPNPQIILADQIDEKILGETLLVLPFDCRHGHDSFVLLDFEEYLMKTRGVSEPVKTLTAVSRAIDGGNPLTILSFSPIAKKDIAEKILRATKFENIQFENDQVVTVRKRHLVDHLFHNGKYRIHEVEKSRDIQDIEAFASNIFSKEFNFSTEIDGMFSSHSDFYAVTNVKTKQLINFARVTWHLPSHALPCMLAQKRGTNLHLQLNNPDKLSYGEIFSPYLNSLGAARTYDELVKTIVGYGSRNLMDVVFTTFDAHEKASYDFFNRYFGFKETGFTLQYGNFGGNWKLISVFKKTQDDLSLNFLSRSESHQYSAT